MRHNNLHSFEVYKDYTISEQGDAAECLELILHKVSPQVSEVFQAKLTNTTKCTEGHIINEETNPFWTLPLSLKDTNDTTYHVEEGFNNIFQSKSYSGDNMVYCNECKKKTDATSGCEMEQCPQILTLLLKRFDFDYNTMSDVKSTRCVEVPHTLQVKNKEYKLYGMVNHMGSLSGGHYTATILSSEDENWFEFNDSHVQKVKEQPFANHRPYTSATVYLLTYRAVESHGPSETNSEALTDNILQKQSENSNLDELRRDDVEYIGKVEERDTDDKKKRKMTHSDDTKQQMERKLPVETVLENRTNEEKEHPDETTGDKGNRDIGQREKDDGQMRMDLTTDDAGNVKTDTSEEETNLQAAEVDENRSDEAEEQEGEELERDEVEHRRQVGEVDTDNKEKRNLCGLLFLARILCELTIVHQGSISQADIICFVIVSGCFYYYHYHYFVTLFLITALKKF
ncbi:ubiquitin carboxyl-terminal hydrolase 47-like [Seriola aureovittata]|uniref:ubiquitin carboxyl-terminal hydrolase 47-like n=1 Tax=Seriola aureovittata TaxID=2871759 RepID=UPI0024BE416C|nr:ubiquitin carboxyl-terminal hydrolase 47-like [Seriola aureovittata]